MIAGDLLTLRAEKPVAGGHMLARHEGRVVLVSGAIPGELVRARVDRAERSMAFATVVDVVEAHPSRRVPACDPRCGGAAYAHVAYAEQLVLKSAIVADALRRVGRVELASPIAVMPSPERGYRMRARLHVRAGDIGFFLEGTHRLCDAMGTGQLLDSAAPAIDAVRSFVRGAGLAGDADVEISESISGEDRVLHIELDADSSVHGWPVWPANAGATGVSWSTRGRGRTHVLFGEPYVHDRLELGAGPGGPIAVRLRRHARAFFQGNRYLVCDLVRRVVACCADGPVLDLYAGVGLFGVSAAALGLGPVVAVEGHPASFEDLQANAEPYGERVSVRAGSVERFLDGPAPTTGIRPTLILDPPRTGMTKEAAARVVAWGAPRVVFVSCDVATFARDVRRFLDGGYRLEHVEGFDLFPNTSHVEVLGVLARP